MSGDDYHALIDDIETRLEFMRSSGVGELYIKRTGLMELEKEVQGCGRCALHGSRTGIYMGLGGARPEVVFVSGFVSGGDGGARPDPFSGEGGELLSKVIKSMGLEESAVYLCYAVKCVLPPEGPPGPRGLDGAAAACGGFLRDQLRALAPKLVIALGTLASRALLGSADLSALMGRIHDWHGMDLIATHGIDEMLKESALKKAVWTDIQKGMRALKD